MNSVKDYLTHHQPKNEGKLTEKFDIKTPGYSSGEAKTVVDGALKQ